jgi:hypothetical protein
VPPIATVQRGTDGTVTVHAIWNGATEVVRWLVLAGDRPHAFWRPLGAADWNGLDTAIALSGGAGSIAVVAVDREGRIIGRSAAVAGQ